MEFRILGPLEVEEDGRLLKLGGAQPRALLALLLLHANEVVARDRLIDALWDGRAPETAATAIQVHVSQLRKVLGRGVIVTQRPGYVIRVADGELDLRRFEEAIGRARGAAPAEAARLLTEALALWRGVPLAELDMPFAGVARARLEERRLAALERRIDADLELARHAELVPELEGLVQEHPLRERLRGQLMLALYRCGRQADALDTYRAGRRLLDEELGLEPGEGLRRLERAILEQDGSLSAAAAQALPKPRAAERPTRAEVVRPARQQRKIVTLVFCDLAESTAMGDAIDPEVLEGRLRRYFERMEAIVERHGGVVEKFIGDAVMAVFGVPVAHEDDGLRGLRAAAEMRDAMPELQLQARIGVNTGEILTSTVGTLVTGDAVNVAARLEQAAAPGVVLVGASTRALVGAAAEVEELEPLDMKGKPDRVQAFRLVSVGEAPARAHDRPFVGRRREVELLREAWDRANAQQACELFTVVGEAGVGKSRLVAEALAAIDARVARARCLPYGEGITYWPVVEVIKQLGARPSDDAAAAAVQSLLGESDRPTSADEIAWAFRKLLEEQAPLVVVLDDLQWGEETFLDLVESTRLLSVGAPILLTCMARPELLERRPSWPGSLRLEPLPPDDAGELIGQGLPEDVRTRVAEAAGGNPLFITEMLALATAGGEFEVPATLRALLTARLDQLEPRERAVLELGAVEGEIFHRGAVQALGPDEPEVMPRLATLVRHELIRPDRPQFPGEDGFRFRHLLIRDAAYDALPKAVRADLHRRFADWLEHKQALVELDEVAGYHLERAARFQAELGVPDPALTLRAGDRLLTAGRRALDRDDVRAATPLLERALTLTRPHRGDVHAELDLARAHMQEPARAAAMCDDAAVRAAEAGDETNEALARAMALFYRLFVVPGSHEELEGLLLEVRPRLEAMDDHAGLAHVWWALGFGVANSRGRPDDMVTASQRAYREGRLAGRAASPSAELGVALVVGSRPADECLELLDRLLAETPSTWLLLNRGWLLAMLDRGEEGRQIAEEAYARNRELDEGRWGEWMLAEISSLAGDYEDATNRLRLVCEWLESMEQFVLLGTYLARRGALLCLLGRFEEAEQLGSRARALDEEFDPDGERPEPVCRQVLARVHAHRGELAEAERLAREAVAITARTEQLLVDQCVALWNLAEVLAVSNRADETAAAFQQALDRCERKKNLALAAQVRRRRDSLLRP